MPTFKQFAFFRLAVRMWPHVAFIGKVDDDTIVHMPVILPILCGAARTPNSFVGAIHWNSVVPHDARAGVLLDTCAFGWSSKMSLHKMFSSTSCRHRGATLPIPYAAGAAYFFSTGLLHELVTAAHIESWVMSAKGAKRNSLQWQKHEDVSTGYFLSSLNVNITYVQLGARLHDFHCRPRPKARSKTLYRPTDPHLSGLVHGLKCPVLHKYAAEALEHDSYNQSTCLNQARLCHA